MSGCVAVVGTINRDVIVARDGTRTESLGGILYNAIPLAALLAGSGIRVLPVGRLGASDLEEARDLLAPFPGIDPSGLRADPGGTNLSLLDYSHGGERMEEVRCRVAELDAADLAPAHGARAWLVNLISGRDVAVGTVARLRAREAGLFLLDIQALARTTDTPRRSRIVPDFAEWSRLFHVVRGSEVEVAHFGGVPGDPHSAAGRVLAAGAGEVLATRGERGARRWVSEPGGLRVTQVPAVPCPHPLDPTGCGDAFLSAVCAGRVLGLAPDDAVRLGTYTGSRMLGLSGLGALTALRDLRAEAAAFEPRWGL